MQIQNIALDKLIPSAANVRKTHTNEGIKELADNIAALGLLQNLQVREQDDKFEVVAGMRRLAALKLLAKEKRLPADLESGIPAHVLNGQDDHEISLAENEMRAAMHPADQFEAFKRLADDGQGNDTIAAKFGVTPKVVEQRLKLAVVSPKLIKAYRAGDMTLEMLMAFTVSDDHKQQEKVWKACRDYEDADTIRDALLEKYIDARRNKLALFVGTDAYKEAGGEVVRDLFDADDQGYFADPVLLNELAQAKLEQIAADLRAKGWKWVEIKPDFGYSEQQKFRKLTPTLSKEARTEADKLIEEQEALDGEDENAQDRYDHIQERLAEIKTEASFSADDMAKSGVVITIAHNGKAELHRGLVSPEDMKAERKTEAKKSKGKKTDKDDEAHLSAALVQNLTAHRTAALQAMLAENPKVALVAVVHSLAVDVIYGRTSGSLKINASVAYLPEGFESTKAHKQLEATTKAVRKGMPKDVDKLWGWLTKQDQKTLLGILALCAGHTVDTTTVQPDSDDHADLAEALKLDMAEWWQPTAENYFSRVSAAQITAALKEQCPKDPASAPVGLKKSELTALAERKLKTTGWLPALLRTPA
jgi:ParB family chromosome partitioning protein